MKKFKKVLSFVAAFTMAMAMVLPFTAMADVTVYVEKPADWDAVCLWPFNVMKDGAALDSAFNPDVVPAAWPGWNMTKDASGYYTYTMACDTFDCCFANTEGTSQTTDITGVATGTWTFSKGVANADGKYEFTKTEGTPSGSAPASTDTTPKTADMAPIAVVAVIGLASVVVVLATRKKAIA